MSTSGLKSVLETFTPGVKQKWKCVCVRQRRVCFTDILLETSFYRCQFDCKMQLIPKIFFLPFHWLEYCSPLCVTLTDVISLTSDPQCSRGQNCDCQSSQRKEILKGFREGWNVPQSLSSCLIVSSSLIDISQRRRVGLCAYLVSQLLHFFFLGNSKHALLQTHDHKLKESSRLRMSDLEIFSTPKFKYTCVYPFDRAGLNLHSGSLGHF